MEPMQLSEAVHLRELARVLLARAENMRVQIVLSRVEGETTIADDTTALSIAFLPSTIDEGLQVIEIEECVRYLVDRAQLRAIARRYDIEPSKLEAFLPEAPEPDGPEEMTIDETRAVLDAIDGSLVETEQERPLRSAEDKLRARIAQLQESAS